MFVKQRSKIQSGPSGIGNCCVWALVACLGTLCGGPPLCAWQESSETEKHPLLVDVEWLEDQLTRPDVRIVDLAHRVKNYKAGHIPGAVFVDWRSDITDQSNPDSYSMLPRQQFEKLMSRLGVKPDDWLVLTDNMDCRSAIRMYLTLRYFGHDRASILNGGTNAWQSAGGLMTGDLPEFAETDYQVTRIRGDYLTSLKSVRQALQDDASIVLDGRPTSQYTGEAPGKVFHTGREHKRRGHITTAINIPWKDNFNEDGTFKSLDELRALYSAGGIGDEHSVTTYCNEGLHATVPWFVLHELLGRDKVQIYDLSLAQWANRDDTEMSDGDMSDGDMSDGDK